MIRNWKDFKIVVDLVFIFALAWLPLYGLRLIAEWAFSAYILVVGTAFVLGLRWLNKELDGKIADVLSREFGQISTKSLWYFTGVLILALLAPLFVVVALYGIFASVIVSSLTEDFRKEILEVLDRDSLSCAAYPWMPTLIITDQDLGVGAPKVPVTTHLIFYVYRRLPFPWVRTWAMALLSVHVKSYFFAVRALNQASLDVEFERMRQGNSGIHDRQWEAYIVNGDYRL